MTRLERMQESLANYEKKIIETKEKIAAEQASLLAKRDEAKAKLDEANAKFAALYDSLPALPVEEGVDTTNGLFENNTEEGN